MAVFDLAAQRMCIRIVYDGVAGAGKTTNLKQLCTLFATQRTTEIHSPAEIRGRTLYFDWVQIAAGVICGFPLICQVITVPGQVVLTPRRKHLLSSADVVVYVCDSTQAGAARAQEGLAVLDEIARERGEAIPFIVQANKQDQADALDGQEVLAALGRKGIPVVEAIATDGIGVIDTFVTTVRTIAHAIEARSNAGTLNLDVRSVETSASVLARLSREAIDPEWAAEMVLEEASDAFLLSGAQLSAFGIESTEEAEPVTPRVSMQPLPEPIVGEVPLPAGDVPTGFVWPAHTGRVTLTTLASDGSLPSSVELDESGGASYVAKGRVLHTSVRARFNDIEEARQALVRAARAKSQLGALLVADTVLVLQPAVDANWLWTIHSRMPTVLESHAQPGRDTDALSRAYARAVLEAVKLGVRHGLYLTGTPSSFGEDGATLRYLGEIENVDDKRRSVGHVVLEALVGLQAASIDVEPFVAVLEQEIGRAAAPLGESPRLPMADDLTRIAATLPAGGDPLSARNLLNRIRTALARHSEAA